MNTEPLSQFLGVALFFGGMYLYIKFNKEKQGLREFLYFILGAIAAFVGVAIFLLGT
jgi:FtsH-binding integral membrane protein